ncbi:cobalt-zinc-cadmium efflux system protein [Motilibacter rhizosphaerae]|uniref:Cobalt-zinc-cadmium efflux system protein n=1 Tax=Motilibacter rhizosphaerae TaxID=598652 RepID=A0A4Q7NWQ0_9ACTN|nr:cation diffusion facilitator family transporter [Motilibacter rhizosphaerae]RZS91756.1 cobalt-zinc-cadmium efflux system protein [Motilibacter rhizosphaerae]
MGQGHSHSHNHSHATAGQRHRGRLWTTLAITAAVVVLEAVGALVTGSVALVADAGHLLSDAAGIGLSLLATAYAGRPATSQRTFGWQRAEILAALANGVLLVLVSAYVLVSGVRQVLHPGHVDAAPMLVVAAVGAAANGASLLLLREGSRESLNLRGAYLEVLGDLLGALAVVVAGAVVLATGWRRADGVAALLVGAMIVPRALALLREAADVLLEATPRGVDLGHVRDHMLRIPGVVDVHDLHAWTITSGVPVLSAHVVVEDDRLTCGSGGVLDALGECLGGHFDVGHCTFQVEPAGHREHEHSSHD